MAAGNNLEKNLESVIYDLSGNFNMSRYKNAIGDRAGGSDRLPGNLKEEIYEMNSRRKGAAGERELAKKLKEYGYSCRRGQQYCGANGDADVIGLPGIHIECKRVEKLNLYDAMGQAVNDSGASDLPLDYKLPAVFHRKNDHEWLVSMRLDDWITLYREWEAGQNKEG